MTYRLNHSAPQIVIIIILFLIILLWVVINNFKITGSHLEWLTLSLTVVIIFLMIIDPIINWWNAPRLEVGFNVTDLDNGLKKRFNFDIFNTGRKSATSVKVIVQLLLLGDTVNDASVIQGFVITKDALLPPLIVVNSWLGMKIEFNLYYKLDTKTISFEWLKRIEKGENIGEKLEKRNFSNHEHARIMIAVTWNFGDLTEHLENEYLLMGNGKNGEPELKKT